MQVHDRRSRQGLNDSPMDCELTKDQELLSESAAELRFH